MDNRFLFRGKRVDTGEWVQGNLLNRSPDETFIAEVFHDGQWFTAPRELHGSVLQVAPATVGQCTGLTAAKSYRGDGGEDLLIYEGDLCIDSLGWVFAVTWDNENARFIGRHSKPMGDTYICYVDRQPKVEIIGNIHDHPELLGRAGE